MDARHTQSSREDAFDDTSRQRAESAGQGAGASGAQDKSDHELLDELERLGHKFREVVETAWNSDERRQAEEKLHSGLRSMAQSLEQGVKDVSSSKGAQELRDAAEGVADRVRRSKPAHELADVLAQGLRSLSEQLDRLEKEMARNRSEETAGEETAGAAQDTTAAKKSGTQSGAEPRDIPIDRET